MAPPRRVFNGVIRGEDFALREWLEPEEDEPPSNRQINEQFLYDWAGNFQEDVDEEDNEPKSHGTLLHLALNKNALTNPELDQRAVVSLLLARGADANAAEDDDDGGYTPLHRAKNVELSAMLLDAGANIDARAGGGNSCCTPLMAHAYYARDQSYELVRFLVSRGADWSLLDDSGRDAEANALDGFGRPSPGCARFLADVRAAGSWFRYVRAPRVELLVLRFAVARGRATPPPVRLRTLSRETVIFERLFGASAEDPRALPLEVFWLVLAFWRPDRDV